PTHTPGRVRTRGQRADLAAPAATGAHTVGRGHVGAEDLLEHPRHGIRVESAIVNCSFVHTVLLLSGWPETFGADPGRWHADADETIRGAFHEWRRTADEDERC